MRKLHALLISASFILGFTLPTTATANPRCECEYDDWVGNCEARIELKGNWFKVISNTPQCSRVDWYTDGNPQVTIVTDGADLEEWLGETESPHIAIQSCKVCKDAEYAGEEAAATVLSTPGEDRPQDAITSPFEGSWSSSARTIIFTTTKGRVELSVVGDSISGTWDLINVRASDPNTAVSGKITSDTTAWVKYEKPGGRTIYLTLIDEDTIKTKYSMGNGVLKRN